jgi:hypothetical protein
VRKRGRDLVGDRLDTHNAEVGSIHVVGALLEHLPMIIGNYINKMGVNISAP